MSPLLVSCDVCGAQGLVKPEFAGRHGKCGTCGNPLVARVPISHAPEVITPIPNRPHSASMTWLRNSDIRANLLAIIGVIVVLGFFGRDWLPSTALPVAAISPAAPAHVADQIVLPTTPNEPTHSTAPGQDQPKLPLGAATDPPAKDTGAVALEALLPPLRTSPTTVRRELPFDCPYATGVRHVAFTPDGQAALTIHATNRGAKFRKWNLHTGTPIGEPIPLPAGNDYQLAFSPEGQRLAMTLSPAQEGLNLLNPQTGLLLRSINTQRRQLSAPAWSRDGAVFIGTESGTVEKWRPQSTGADMTLSASQMVTRVDCSADGGYVILGDATGELRLASIHDGQFAGSYRGLSGPVRLIETRPYAEGVLLLAAAGEFGSPWEVQLLDLQTLKRVHSVGLPGHVMSLAVTPDWRRLIAGTRDGKITVLDTITGLELEQASVHNADVTALAVAPDGSGVLSGCYRSPQNRDVTVRLRPLNPWVAMAPLAPTGEPQP
ncbi:hypothetical protein GC163_24540 [bacterium]|nr:hypothetical protein [bacterium]